MKNKFIKNLNQILSFVLSIIFIIVVISVAIILGNVKGGVILLSLLPFVIILVLFFTFGFYFVCQKAIINEEGITIIFFTKVIKKYSWNEVEGVVVTNYMKNPALRIKIINGSEIYLDKRKSIIRAIEYYSKKQITK